MKISRLFIPVICSDFFKNKTVKDMTDITNQTCIYLIVLNGILVNIQQRALSDFEKVNVN